MKAWRDRLSALKNIPPVLKLLWDASPKLAASELALRGLVALLPVATLYVGKLIIDLVANQFKHPGPVPGEIWWFLAAEFVLAGLGGTMGRAIDYCDGRIADHFAREVTVRVMAHAETLDLASFEDPVFYDKLERARVQATDRIGMLHAMGTLIQQAVTLISLSVAVIIFSPLLFAILIVTVVPAFLGESHFSFLGYALAYSVTPLRRELDYLRDLGTRKESAKELKVFGLGKYLQDRFKSINDEVIGRNRRLAIRRLRAGAILALLGSIGYYGSYAYVVFRTLEGALTIGDLTLLAGALAGCSAQIQALFSTFSGIADQALFLSDLIEFFSVKPKIAAAANPVAAPRRIRDGIEFRDVCFSYPGTSRLVINHLDFRMEPGERIALVGENGQGKTTIVKLIARLYDPNEGRILLDGIDLRDYDMATLHREIGVIFQDFMRYDLTARENIAVGRLEHMHDDKLLLEAARKSRAYEVIAKFPHGLEQMLGRRFEDGVDLSGGEWQKIALARAYLRDAQILILDEPTAALDAFAEYEVFNRFAELTKDKMALLISHRFSTVRMADRIVVLEGGAIQEQGTHQELIDRGGRYAGMFELQAANYR
ncbi:MAG: ABC transporter ATP-binding protein [Bryobacteraceae bacterium]